MKKNTKKHSLCLILIGLTCSISGYGADTSPTAHDTQTVVSEIKVLNENLLVSSMYNWKSSVIKLLAIPGIQINFQHSYYGDTALMRAADKGHTEIMELLLAADAQVNLASANGWTALMLAAYESRVSCVEMLLAAGAEVNLHNREGCTALILAADQGSLLIVKHLLAAGAHINNADRFGETALIKATFRNNPLMVKELLAANADPLMRNYKGKDARDIAVERNNSAIENLFEEYYPMIKPAA